METSHIQRWLTALILLPLLGLIIFKGGAFLFCIMISAVAYFAFSEWNKITDTHKTSLKRVRNLPYFLIPLLFAGSYFENKIFFLLVITCIGALIFVSLRDFDETIEHFKGSLYAIAGFFYTCVLLCFVFKIRLLENGIGSVLLLVFAVFASDTGAFYAGRFFGNKKLMPKVSPKKTIEGFIGGFILAIIISLIFKMLFCESLSFFNAFLCGLGAGIFVPLGDLFESMTKRVFDVKDSGTILPGHGGILDRIDGLLFASPVIYILITL